MSSHCVKNGIAANNLGNYTYGMRLPEEHSPSQIVPEIDGGSSNLVNKPRLKIVDQPLDKFRFRYQSEMMGPHGSLPGKTQTEKGKRGCPVVELCGFSGDAVIKCTLMSVPRKELHPHKLVVRDQTDDIMESVDVRVGPSYGGYIAGFEGMGIVHTAKKDIVRVLLQKYEKNYRYRNMDFEKEKANLYAKCKTSVKEMDLNKVCLCFSAHNLYTKVEICDPVYSDIINNLKAAATGVLKIVDYSKSKGLASGGDKIYMFVEKVMKKKIKIRFFSDEKDEPWESWASFTELDVHHQYGIVFWTPAYKTEHPEEDVRVWMELYRTSDGERSEPRQFIYKANPKSAKRPRLNHYTSTSFSSGESFRGKSAYGAEYIIPTVLPNCIASNTKESKNFLAEALMSSGLKNENMPVPMLPQMTPTGITIRNEDNNKHVSNESINYSDLVRQVLKDYGHLPPEVNDQDVSKALEDYRGAESEFEPFMNSRELSINFRGDFIECDANAGTAKILKIQQEKHPGQTTTASKTLKLQQVALVKQDVSKSTFENPIKNVDKSLYKESELKVISDMIEKLSSLLKKSSVSTATKAKINEIAQYRMENGDSIFHVLASCKATSLALKLERKLTSIEVATDLLNHANSSGRTLLHYTVIYNLPNLLCGLLMNDYLESNKTDVNDNAAVHLAVLYGRVDCLKRLLSGGTDVNVIIDTKNGDDLCPFLLCARAGNASCELADLLLEANVEVASARDNSNKNILHLAVSAQNVKLIKHLLKRQFFRESINEMDLYGSTPLHMACILTEEIASPIVRLLLEAGADPLIRINSSSETALNLVTEQSQIYRLLNENITLRKMKEEMKIEENDIFNLVTDLRIKQEDEEADEN